MEGEGGRAMPSKTDVMIWGFVVIAMCIVALDIMNPLH
jgi:hypothetical protein